jgi:hypothetical protein
MSHWLNKIWKDPVWSRVIVVVICNLPVWLWGLFTTSGAQLLGIMVPVWLALLIALGISISSILLLSKVFRSIYGFKPELRLITMVIPEPKPEKILKFPVKCCFKFRNDSCGVVDVRILDYKPDVVTLKGLPVEVLQIWLNPQWCPTKSGVDQVAVLPGQLFQGWIGPDEEQFSSSQVNELKGKIGTLILSVNGALQEFKL